MKDKILKEFDEKILEKAKEKCFASQTARIFWDGWGSDNIKDEWIKKVEDEQVIDKQFLIKTIAQTREETIKEILKLMREYIKENEKLGHGNRVITADELYDKISILRDNL